MLLFVDLETSGLEAKDRICSLGIIAVDQDQSVRTLYDLVNEGKKIPPKASSIHHITNEMIQNKVPLKQCQSYQFLEQHNNKNTIWIGHNPKFDLLKLQESGFEFQGEIIDTLRCTRHLIPECEFFSLQYLRYELQLYKQEHKAKQECGIEGEIIAHHALSDCLIVKLLYATLLDLAPQEQLQKLSQQNVLLEKFNFGKYNACLIEEVATNDRGYLEWMLHNIVDLDEDLRYSITYYLEETL